MNIIKNKKTEKRTITFHGEIIIPEDDTITEFTTEMIFLSSDAINKYDFDHIEWSIKGNEDIADFLNVGAPKGVEQTRILSDDIKDYLISMCNWDEDLQDKEVILHYTLVSTKVREYDVPLHILKNNNLIYDSLKAY